MISGALTSKRSSIIWFVVQTKLNSYRFRYTEHTLPKVIS